MAGTLWRTMGVGAAVVAAVLVVMPLVVPAAVKMAGFGEHGIVAGSWAAKMMRWYGGAVPAGSLCALLQRVGTRRQLDTSSIIVAEGVAAALAGMSAFFFKRQASVQELEAAPAAFYYQEVAQVEESAALLEAPPVEASESARDVDSAEDDDEADSSASPANSMHDVAFSSPNQLPSPFSTTDRHDSSSMLLNPFALHEHSFAPSFPRP